MSKGKKPPSPEQVAAAKAKAEAKALAAQKKAEEAAKKLAEELKSDQQWVDAHQGSLSAEERDELYRQGSRRCKDTSLENGKITLACPLPKKLQYCVEADSFDPPLGRVPGALGGKLSPEISKSLKDGKTCINGEFVSAEEGGSYLSPYVPWGPISGATKDGKPVLTDGNSSGVTIGTGVDLGAISQPDPYLKQLEAAGVSKATRDKLKPLLGKKKADACKALREAKGDGTIVLPADDVEKIDTLAFKSRVPILKSQFATARTSRMANLQSAIAQEKKAKQPDAAKIAALEAQAVKVKASSFDDLTCNQQSVLFSTMYHEGSIGKANSAPFVNALLEGDDDAAQAALKAKSESSNKLLAQRGKAELAFYTGGS